jgi:hypothetical protein
MNARELFARLRLDLGPVRDSVQFRRLWLAQMVSFIGSEIGYVALSYPGFALVLLAVAGGADLVSAVLRGTMLLELTPDSLRGRLNWIEFAQVAAALSLGNLRAGALASVTSIRASVASGGIACVAGCAVLALAFPALIRYDARARAAAAA